MKNKKNAISYRMYGKSILNSFFSTNYFFFSFAGCSLSRTFVQLFREKETKKMYTTSDAKGRAFIEEVQSQYKRYQLKHAGSNLASLSFDKFAEHYGPTIAQHAQMTNAHIGKELVTNAILPGHVEANFDQNVDQIVRRFSDIVLGSERVDEYNRSIDAAMKKARDSGKYIGDRLSRIVANVDQFNLGQMDTLKGNLASTMTLLWQGLLFEVAKDSDDERNIYDFLDKLEQYLVIVHEKSPMLGPGTKTRLVGNTSETAFNNGKIIKDHVISVTQVDSLGKKTPSPFSIAIPIVAAARIRHQLNEDQFIAVYAIVAGILGAAKTARGASTKPIDFIKFPSGFKNRYQEIYEARRKDSQAQQLLPPLEEQRQADIEGSGDQGPAAAPQPRPVPPPRSLPQADSLVRTAKNTGRRVRMNAAAATTTTSVSSLLRDLQSTEAPAATQFEVETTLRSDFVQSVIKPHLEKMLPTAAAAPSTILVFAPENVQGDTINVWKHAPLDEKSRFVSSYMINGSSATDSKISTADGKSYSVDWNAGKLIMEPALPGGRRLAVHVQLPVDYPLHSGHKIVVIPLSAELVSARNVMTIGAQTVDSNLAESAKKKASAMQKKIKDKLSKKADKEIKAAEKILKADPSAQDKEEIKELDRLIAQYEQAKSEGDWNSDWEKQLKIMNKQKAALEERLRAVSIQIANRMVASSMNAMTTATDVDGDVDELAVGAQFSKLTNEQVADKWKNVKRDWNDSNGGPHLDSYYPAKKREMQQLIAELINRKLAVSEDFAFLVDCNTCGGKNKKKKEEEDGGNAAVPAPTQESVDFSFRRSAPAPRPSTPLDLRVKLLQKNPDRTFFLTNTGDGLYIAAGKRLRYPLDFEKFVKQNPRYFKYGVVRNFVVYDETPTLKIYHHSDNAAFFLSIDGQGYELSYPTNLGSMFWFGLTSAGIKEGSVQIWPAGDGASVASKAMVGAPYLPKHEDWLIKVGAAVRDKYGLFAVDEVKKTIAAGIKSRSLDTSELSVYSFVVSLTRFDEKRYYAGGCSFGPRGYAGKYPYIGADLKTAQDVIEFLGTLDEGYKVVIQNDRIVLKMEGQTDIVGERLVVSDPNADIPVWIFFADMRSGNSAAVSSAAAAAVVVGDDIEDIIAEMNKRAVANAKKY
jgi:hypothetical protein